ncbi:YkgJ family cysteine cluster protein [Lyngbya confervoides]|uniref:YkgJ family cysteine cluster protein n=1 Tax=Lyngbya confervoides BDU141951 TaxID=1574623 RepID=A0ABD4T6E9_9CYAN|nr:YkgJ family cysteine cluster protein [Lyngbya confervoides]MCM1984288.1 YkgJ family cysteine cluster protein [Lyngbya confervoides BDU141951]
MATWQCVKQCGACCQLDPGDRPDLATYLTPEQLGEYLSMVGPDGWCIHFDSLNRDCTIYEDRPTFCRVTADTFGQMFGIEPQDLNAFAIDCCRQQIEAIYGDRSLESLRFEQAIGLEIG